MDENKEMENKWETDLTKESSLWNDILRRRNKEKEEPVEGVVDEHVFPDFSYNK